MSVRWHLAALAFLIGLAGCGMALSPEAQCFADATFEYGAAWRGAETIRGDLARGYALFRPYGQNTARLAGVPCRVAGRLDTCLGTQRHRVVIPVSIDRAELRARLAVLDAKMARLRPAAMAAAAPCGYGDRAAPD